MTKKVLTAILAVVFMTAGFSGTLLADATPGQPAANRILIIYSTYGTLGTQLKNEFSTILGTLTTPPVIDYLTVAASSGAGFYNELIAQYPGETDLRNWCQVWDLRFTELYPNPGVPCSYTLSEEQLSLGAGATTDQGMYRALLQRGGGLFIQAEHNERPCRNTNVIAFMNTVANTGLGVTYAGVVINAGGIVPITASNYGNFDTDFNSISGSMNLQWPGGIPTWALGSGTSLITANLPGATSILMGYMAGALNTGAGNMIVSWESGSYTTPQANTLSDNVIKNSYDFLSNVSCVYTTATITPTRTPGPTLTVTPTITNTATRTVTPTITVTFTRTATASLTMTATNPPTATVTPTSTPDFSFVLVTVYPNPTTDKNWIVYDLTRDSDVTISIFTVSGEKIRVIKQQGIIGRNKALWDGKNTSGNEASSGVYAFSIEAVSGKDSSKLQWGKFAVMK